MAQSPVALGLFIYISPQTHAHHLHAGLSVVCTHTNTYTRIRTYLCCLVLHYPVQVTWPKSKEGMKSGGAEFHSTTLAMVMARPHGNQKTHCIYTGSIYSWHSRKAHLSCPKWRWSPEGFERPRRAQDWCVSSDIIRQYPGLNAQNPILWSSALAS